MPITRDDWMAAVKEAEGIPEESDALTVTEFMALMGMKRTTARKQLLDLVRLGKAQYTTKRQRNMQGVVIEVPAYTLVKS